MRIAACALVLVLGMPLASLASGGAPVEYTVRLDDPQTQVVRIDARFPGVSGEAFDVHLPVWRPGLYLVLDNAGTVRTLSAANTDGRPLPVRKTRKSSWRIDTSSLPASGGDVIVSTEIYANSIANRTRHVDDTHAFLSGSSVFLFSEEHRDSPVAVDMRPPGGGAQDPGAWRIASGMATDAHGRLVAANYDILIDSPIEFGLHERVDFEAAGADHAFVVWGRFDGDLDRIARDTASIAEVQAAIFGGLPYEDYVVLTHSAAGLRGGTEHYNSTVLSVDPRVWRDEDRYERFLSLVAHEIFHTWNIKRFRPAELDRYEYLEETYTQLLWIVEGTTSYYDDLTLPRAGLVSADRYLEILGDAIDAYRRTPGRLVQPLSASSFDAWIKLFHRGADRTPDRANSEISFYLKGALVSFVLDMAIRKDTANAASLDDVMRLLYERFPLGGGGYTTEDLRTIVRELAPGVDLDAFFEDWVDGLEEVDFESAVTVAGLELIPPDDGDDTEAYFGLSVEAGGVVRSASSDGPAYHAGVTAGDEIVAVNGLRVGGGSTGSFSDILETIEPGQTVSLTVFRRDVLRSVEMTAAERPAGEWTIRRSPDASPEARAIYASWIGAPWEPPTEPHEHLHTEPMGDQDGD